MSSKQSSEITLSLRPGRAVLSCDMAHIHSDIGSLTQTFVQEEDSFPFMGEQSLFVSSFALFPPDSAKPTNFSYLGREITAQIWQQVFALKNMYLEQKAADVIQHIVKHPFSIERRFELYKGSLNLASYDIWHDSSNIWLERNGN